MEKRANTRLGKNTLIGSQTIQISTIDDPIVEIKRVAVITGTIGTRYLEQCILSVQAQECDHEIVHWIVVDGREHAEKVQYVLNNCPITDNRRIVIMILPFNTGADGFNAHKIYAGVSHIVDADFIEFLDEDNWIEPNHVAIHLNTIGQNDASYSLRNVVNQVGEYICQDNCESLGIIDATPLSQADYLIDTSCYLMTARAARRISSLWHVKRTADRSITKAAIMQMNLICTFCHTLNYRTSSSAASVKADFFIKNNQVCRYDFSLVATVGNSLKKPLLKKPILYLFHFNYEQTINALNKCVMNGGDGKSHALDEWMPSCIADLPKYFNVINGFANVYTMHPNSVVLINLCHPGEIPFDLIGKRNVKTILYTLESPNIRHQKQWDAKFLSNFDSVLTYWDDVAKNSTLSNITYFPHNTHMLADADAHLLYDNRVYDKSICIVLENRNISGEYEINGVVLHAQDYLRVQFATGLDNVTAYGVGWDDVKGIRVGHTLHRSKDAKFAVDYYKEYTFAIIIENCDATGYVSEKFYDCLIAGCIPIYYGNITPRLNIPDSVYINVKKYSISALNKFINNLTQEQIGAYKNAIKAHRDAILDNVSARKFAECINAVATDLLK